jgi:nicotinic acid phosphoribosyltransferase
MTSLPVPLSVLTDSYKSAHFEMYPDSKKMVAYGEFRCSYDKTPDDHRFVFYGIRYIIETFVAKRWTMEDLENADKFFKTHNSSYTPFPFPKNLFEKFIRENDGYFPGIFFCINLHVVKIEALPEGSVVHVHTPVYQITAQGEYTLLVTFLETLLTQVWYPTTVATLSRMTKGRKSGRKLTPRPYRRRLRKERRRGIHVF